MESAVKLDVPLTVDLKVGDDWESMTPLTRRDAVLAEVDEAPEELPAALVGRLIRRLSCPNFRRSRPLRATCAPW